MASQKAKKRAAGASASDDIKNTASPAPNNVKVIATANRMRNPHTGAVFSLNIPTDVIDLQSVDNTWTRSQIKAGVLAIV